jgi:hypothetical protein
MFIEMNLGDVCEPKPVAPGRYALTIADAKYNDEKKYIEVSIGIDGFITAPNIRQFISLPKPEDDAGKSDFKKLLLKRFLRQFGIVYNDSDGFSVEDFAGATAEAQVELSEPDAKTGAVYNRLVTDRLPNEEDTRAKR